MSHTPALELDSQTQLLSRLQFLTRFGSSLIHITGPQGAGKTWLAEQFLAHWCDDANQALLACYANQSPAQQRVMLLKQLFSAPLFNEEDPLVDSFERMQGERPCRLLLLVDDADLLSPTLLAELWALVMRAQQHEAWQINVLLFSQPKKLDNALRQLSHGQGISPVDIDISPLSENEMALFAELLKARLAMNATARRQLQHSLQQCPPWPGALFALLQQQAPVPADKSKAAISPLQLCILLVTLLGAGAVWWLLPVDEHVSALNTELDVESEPQQPEVSPDLVPATREVEPTEDHLPSDEINPDGLTVGRTDEQAERIVVPAEVVDSLIAEQDLGLVGAAAPIEGELVESTDEPTLDDEEATTMTPPVAAVANNTAVDDVAALSPNTGPKAVVTEVVATKAHEVAAPAAEPVVEQAPAKPKVEEKPVRQITVASAPVTNPAAKSEPAARDPKETSPAAHPILNAEALLARPSGHYALQFAAVKSEAEIDAFLAKHPKMAEFEVLGYRATRGSQPWYLLVVGDFDSVSAARRAEMALPDELKLLEPWVKSYRQIHAEINSSN